MKNVIVFSVLLAAVTSCTSVKQIGKVNMVSNRNVDSKMDYNVLTTYSGGSKKELRKTRAVSIEDAVDQTVRKIPGGEFLMNAKIYLVNGKYIAVEGDVWGQNAKVAYRGFKIGDKVTWKSMGTFKSGSIKALKDDKSCLVEYEKGDIMEKKYDELSKGE